LATDTPAKRGMIGRRYNTSDQTGDGLQAVPDAVREFL